MKKTIITTITILVYLLISSGYFLLIAGCGEITKTSDTMESNIPVDENLQVKNVILESIGENKLELSWIPPENAEENVEHYIAELLPTGDEGAKVEERVEVEEITDEQKVQMYATKGDYAANVAVVSKKTGERVAGVPSSSDPVAIVTEASAPGETEITVIALPVEASGEAGLEVSWTVPADTGKAHNGDPASIVRYTVYWQESAKGAVSVVNYMGKLTTTKTTEIISRLNQNTEYGVMVEAENSSRLKSISNEEKIKTEATTPLLPPAGVEGFLASAQLDGSINLNWVLTENFGTTAEGFEDIFSEYRLYWAKGQELALEEPANHSIKTIETSTYTISEMELAGYSDYTIAIVVVNASGIMSPAQTKTVTTADLSARPTAVLGFTAENTSDGSINLSWREAKVFGVTSQGEVENFKEYRLYWTEGTTVEILDVAQHTIETVDSTEYQIPATELRGDADYAIAIVVVNSSGKVGVSSHKKIKTIDMSRAPDKVEIANSASTATSAVKAKIEISWAMPEDAGAKKDGSIASIEKYTIYWAKGSTVSTVTFDNMLEFAGTATEGSIIDLEQDSEYSIIIITENSAGLESSSAVVTVRTAVSQATAPSAPTIEESSIDKTKNTEEEARIEFSWTAPTAAGLTHTGTEATIARYMVYWKQGSTVTVESAEATSNIPFGTSASIGELMFQTEYSFIVVAENSAGITAASTVITIETWAASGATAPAKLSTFNAQEQENGELLLNWNQAENFGTKNSGEELIFAEYRLYWVEGATVPTSGDANHVIQTKSTTSYRIAKEEFLGATEYAFAIVVVNEVGLQSEKNEVKIYTESREAAPAKIENFDATTPMSGAIGLLWDAASDFGKKEDGGDDSFQAYHLYWAEGTTVDTSNPANHVIATEGTESYVILADDLLGFTDYTVAILVVNSGGRESAASKVTVRTADRSAAPAGVGEFSATAQTDGSIDLSWTAASNFGALADGSDDSFQEYQLYWAEGATVDTSGMANHVIATELTTTYTIEETELKGVSDYTVAILVVNSGGRESVASKKTVQTADRSAAPAGVGEFSATAQADGSIDLSWAAASNFGALADGSDDSFQEYQLYWAEGATVDTSGMANHVIATELTTAYTIEETELKGVTDYTVAILVVNSGGRESAASKKTVQTVDRSVAPAGVGEFSATAQTDGSIDLSWTAASDFGALADGSDGSFQEYQLYWAEGATVDTSGMANHVIATELTTTYTVEETELKGVTDYTVAILVVNSGGRESAASKKTVQTVDRSVEPAAVTEFIAAVQADGTVDLGWTVASYFGKNVNGADDSFKEYRLYWAEGTTVDTSGIANRIESTLSTSSYKITGLQGATEYTAAIVLVNSSDLASASTEKTFTTPSLSTAPGPISNLEKDSAHTISGELKVTWTAGASGVGANGQDTAATEYHAYIAEDGIYATVPDLIATETALITTSTESIFTGLTEETTYQVVIVAVNSESSDKMSDPGYGSFVTMDWPPQVGVLNEIRELDREYTIQFTEPISLAITQSNLPLRIRISVNGGIQRTVASAQVSGSGILIGVQTILLGQTINIAMEAGLVEDDAGNVNKAESFELTVARQLSGEVRTVVGVSSELYGHLDGIGSSARLYSPSSFAFDSEGNIIISDTYNNRIRKMDMTTGMASTIAGTGTKAFLDGPADQAQFSIPWGIGITANDKIIIADLFNRRIRELDITTSMVSTIAGSGTYGYQDGIGVNAQFKNAGDLDIGPDGNIYMTDTHIPAIRKVDINTNEVTTVTVNGDLTNIKCIAFDADGNIILTAGYLIKKLDMSTGDLTIIAGSVQGYADENGTEAQFNNLLGIDIDEEGNIYVADRNNAVIRKIDSDYNVTTIAGKPMENGLKDGSGAEALFSAGLTDIVLDAEGNIYIADRDNNAIRKIFK